MDLLVLEHYHFGMQHFGVLRLVAPVVGGSVEWSHVSLLPRFA